MIRLASIDASVQLVGRDLRACEVQITAVNRATADHAFHAFVLDRAQRFDVGHVGQAAGGDHRNGQRLGQLAPWPRC